MLLCRLEMETGVSACGDRGGRYEVPSGKTLGVLHPIPDADYGGNRQCNWIL